MTKQSKYQELTPKQQMAILEFIRGNSLSYKEIARKVGVSRRTLYNWRHDAKFKEVLEQEADELRLTVLKTSGMVVTVNALSKALTRDVELINFTYIGERIYKLETQQVKIKEIFKIISEEFHKLENDIMELKNHLAVDKNNIN